MIVIVGTPFDFRMGYGKRISTDPTLVQIDMDYRTVGKNRDIDARPGRRSRRDSRRGAAGRQRAASSNDKRQARQQWMKKLCGAEEAATEKLMPLFKSDQHADPSLSRRLGDQRVPRPRTRSTSATAATWSRSPRRRCGRAVRASGWTRARWARSASAPASRSRPGSRIRTRKCSATTATARSA